MKWCKMVRLMVRGVIVLYWKWRFKKMRTGQESIQAALRQCHVLPDYLWPALAGKLMRDFLSLPSVTHAFLDELNEQDVRALTAAIREREYLTALRQATPDLPPQS